MAGPAPSPPLPPPPPPPLVDNVVSCKASLESLLGMERVNSTPSLRNRT